MYIGWDGGGRKDGIKGKGAAEGKGGGVAEGGRKGGIKGKGATEGEGGGVAKREGGGGGMGSI